MNGVEEIIAIVRADEAKANSSGEMEVNRSHEMIRHTPTMSILFTVKGEHIQSNVAARSYYFGTNNDRGDYHVRGRELHLKDVLETCLWEDNDDDQVSMI